MLGACSSEVRANTNDCPTPSSHGSPVAMFAAICPKASSQPSPVNLVTASPVIPKPFITADFVAGLVANFLNPDATIPTPFATGVSVIIVATEDIKPSSIALLNSA